MKATIERFRNLLEATPDAVVMVSPSGRIEHANTQAEKLFGYQQGELCGKTLDILLPERFRGGHAARHTQYVNESGMRSMGAGLELYALRKDGSEFPVDISLSPLETSDGILVISAIRDMTKSKLFDQTLKKKNLELSCANKELDAFSYSISHDLRAPLRHVLGYVELLKMSLGSNLAEKPRHYLDEIAGSAKQMAELVDNLLDFARMGRAEIQMGVVDMNELARNVIAGISADISDRNIRWNIHPLPALHADTAMLKCS